jgi:monoamine oxidase
MQSKLFDRRGFLTLAGVSLLGASSCRSRFLSDTKRFGPNSPGNYPSCKGKSVAILGGGVSGLCTAYHLERQGFQVTVLEASSRCGGRIRTERGQFENDQHVELGATRFPDFHLLTHQYLRAFDVELSDLKTEHSKAKTFFKGKSVASELLAEWLQLNPVERILGVESLYAHYVKKALNLSTYNLKSPWAPTPELLIYDKTTYTKWFETQNISPGAMQYIRATVARDFDGFSAFFFLLEDSLDQRWQKTFQAKSGNDQLIEGFVKKLKEPVLLHSKALELNENAGQIQVTWSKSGKVNFQNFDFVVSTIPYPLMNKLTINCTLSEMQQRALRELNYHPVSRINLQFESRFWNHSPFNTKGLQVAVTDELVSRFWDMTAAQSGKTGILTAYTQGNKALEISARSPQERIEMCLEIAHKIFPGAKQHFNGRASQWQWHEQPDMPGAYVKFAPHQVPLLQAMQSSDAAEGRLLFAGDQASYMPGWVQGALESSERVVQQIMKSCEVNQNIFR